MGSGLARLVTVCSSRNIRNSWSIKENKPDTQIPPRIFTSSNGLEIISDLWNHRSSLSHQLKLSSSCVSVFFIFSLWDSRIYSEWFSHQNHYGWYIIITACYLSKPITWIVPANHPPPPPPPPKPIYLFCKEDVCCFVHRLDGHPKWWSEYKNISESPGRGNNI